MLTSKRIHLRPVTADDTPQMVTWRNLPQILEAVFSPGPISPEEHQIWFASLLKNPARLEFIIALNDSGCAIGRIGLDHIDHLNQKAEYSISIGEVSEWGKGYGREATDLILAFGFNELNLHKIYLRVLARNQQAIKMYQSAGFSVEGTLVDEVFKNGVFQTALHMSIFREDFFNTSSQEVVPQ